MKYFLQILNTEPQEVTYSLYVKTFRHQMKHTVIGAHCPASFNDNIIKGWTEETNTNQEDKIFVCNFLKKVVENLSTHEIENSDIYNVIDFLKKGN